MKSRPTKQKLKQRGILRERVFGCDLGEHLLNSGHDVPQVLKSCTEFIEKHGIVDGMYRLSGIASNIQKLRHEFDSEQIPDLTKDVYIQDIHCVGSLCKLYFRELPNPLLTYQLYEKFSEAVSAATDEERLIKIHDVIQQLPPPHYRTLEFLMRHLSHLATFSYVTNMHSKNLAIVWAPNLLRSKQIESACFSGTAAFMEVRIQSVVVEFILNHVDVLFSPKLSSLIREGAGHNSLSRPKSLLVSSPSTKLLTLEEAQARTQAQINSPVTADSKYIEVGEGPAALQGKFHTVIEFPMERKRPPVKAKKSPVGSWRSFFNLGKSSSMSKRKLQRNPSEPNELKAMALSGFRGDTGTLRSAKSEESLSSLHNVDGESKVHRPRRPRSSSDALSASFNGDLLDRQQCNSYDNLTLGESDEDEGPIRVPALISPPRSTEDVDLSPPDIGMASLDFDPMSFQCSLPPAAESGFPAPELPAGDGAGGSEPALPSPDKFACPAQSPDLSLALGEKTAVASSSSSSSSAKNLSRAPSPKSSRKPVVSEAASEGAGQRPSPSPLGSLDPGCLASHTGPVPASDGCQYQQQFYQLSSTLSGPESRDPASAVRPEHGRPAYDQYQPGAVVLDSPQGPDPVSSVSLLPPPPPKNAARMLALALAESAQQAAILSQRRPSVPLTPVSPLRPEGPLDFLEWPSPPIVKPPVTPEEPTPATTDAPSVLVATSHVDCQAPVTKDKSPSTTTVCASKEISGFSSISVTTTPSSQCTARPTSPPTCASPPQGSSEKPRPAAGQVPSSVPPAANCKGTGPTLQRGIEIQGGTTLLPTLQKPPEQPIKVVQPRPVSWGAPVTSATSDPAEEPSEAVKPGQGQADSVPHHHTPGSMPPAPPVRSIESKLATAALSRAEPANASNFHAILAEASVPASVEEVLPHPPPPPRKSSTHLPAYLYHPEPMMPAAGEPYYHQRTVPAGQGTQGYHHYRPDCVPPHASYVSKSEPQIPFSPRVDGCYATLGPRSFHHSMKSRTPHHGGDYVHGHAGHQGHHPQGYGSMDGAGAYSTIRRVHSLHVPRSVPISRTEVPPDDQLFCYQRPTHQCKSYPPAPQADYHVTQLQPYFENGRVQYRYSPYSGSGSLDAPYYDVDPYGTIRLRHVHSFSARNLAPHLGRSGARSGGYHYLSRHVLAAGKEHSFVSRDMPPSHSGAKGPAVYLAWDPEEADRLRVHSIRRESRARQKAKGPVMSQYDNVGPYPGPSELGGLEVLHLRSKSDPGKLVLAAPSAEEKEGHYAPRHMHSDPEALVYMETEKHCQGNGVGDRMALPSKERSSRTGGWEHPPQSVPPPPSRHLPQQPEPLRPEPKSDPADGRHRPERHTSRHKPSSGYTEEESPPPPAPHPKQTAPPKPERSHIVRERPLYHPPTPQPHPHLADNPERGEHSGAYLCQSQRYSTMTVMSHYDNLDDYQPTPQPPQTQTPTPAPARVGSGAFPPPPASAPPNNNRAYSTALGQGAFVPTELSMQRPEAEVRAE